MTSAIFDFRAINRKTDEIAAERSSAIAGTDEPRMLFQQSTEPIGWAKALATHYCGTIKTGVPRAGDD